MYTWQTALLVFLIMGHAIGSVYTIYVHRGKGHHVFEFTPVLEHFFRFFLWLVLGFVWKNWAQHFAAKHRKHHRYSDSELDPHSPHHYTFKQMLDVAHSDPNKANYISPEEVEEYAPDIASPNDWVELNVYLKYPRLGMMIYWILWTVLFGWTGFILGAINYRYMPIMFIWMGNYVSHKYWFAYAKNKGADRSRILFPWGIFCGGEELHTHHHNDASLPYFHRHWWEIDAGWIYARILIFFRLMRLTNYSR
jgi:stearoyl-CoA desaturase (delta-9 desaturase)